MLLNVNTDPTDNSSCTLVFDETEQWLSTTWKGYVDALEAREGAAAYLRHAVQQPCALLLNDNYGLRGPWFDSLDWLVDVWVPQAGRMGLRHVAHIIQADRHDDTISSQPLPYHLPFDLQIFREVEDAKQWLRQCRQQLTQS
jgi:hypothetical protein